MSSIVNSAEVSGIVIGGPDPDDIEGGAGSDIIDGGSHRDFLNGGAGRDVMLGGSGGDTIGGGSGRDVVRGGSGDDIVSGGADRDFVRGDTGNDLVTGEGGDDRLFGDAGNDSIYGGSGDDILVGGTGDDQMFGGEGADRFLYFADAGDDIIQHFEVDADVFDLRLLPEAISFEDLEIVDNNDGSGCIVKHPALDGSIELKGIDASSLSKSNFVLPDGTMTPFVIDGTWFSPGSDPFEGSENATSMFDRAGDTHILAKGGSDNVFGGEGDDHIEGGDGHDDLYGEEGRDIVEGGEGDDRIFGGEGDDHLIGGADRDWILGGEGDDRLRGGTDADIFAFGVGHGSDTIIDFTVGEDQIDFSAIEEISGLDDVQMETYGRDTVIDLTDYGGGFIRIENTDSSDLGEEAFVFHEPPATTEPVDEL